MIETDMVRKYLAHEGSVRVVMIDATKMVTEARNTHLLSNVATAALGRALMGTCLMASKLKGEENRLTVQIKGNGPLGGLIVCANSKLEMKGYVNVPDVELPLSEIGKLDVATAVGKGYLNVIKDLGLKEPYVGFSELISGEIAEDFAYYFATSEQTPCVVALGVNIAKDNTLQKACGYLIEPLPNCKESVLDTLEAINSAIASVTYLMLDLDNNMDDVVKTITGDNQIVLLEEVVPKYKCDCNEERIEKTIISLGKQEARTVLEENNNQIEIRCDFCNKVYRYDYDMVDRLFE